jgi:hypothetical protein
LVAKIIIPPTALPEGDEMAVPLDPQKNVIRGLPPGKDWPKFIIL